LLRIPNVHLILFTYTSFTFIKPFIIDGLRERNIHFEKNSIGS
jgi:hypothetical protein